jgi:fumarylacetoacetate (FAA) hydrolase
LKLASLRAGRDGQLRVVSRDLSRATAAPHVAPTLQAALDRWAVVAPELERVASELERDEDDDAEKLAPEKLAAPLPRAYQWLDASAYLHHVELVRRARGAELPESFRSDPLMYQGGSDVLLGPRQEICCESEAHGIDFEAEVAVILDDVPAGVPVERAADHIRLITLVNDVSLRALIPQELGKGFGFVHGKPPTAFAPVAVTPDELGDAWDGRRLHGALRVWLNGEPFGWPDAGEGMAFDFAELISHAARTRPLGAGTVLGSGTVSNADRSVGSCCIAERRVLELLESGKPETPFLHFGDVVRIEMLDAAGESRFGAIEQRIVPSPPVGI